MTAIATSDNSMDSSQTDNQAECHPSKKSLAGLDWLNFFLSDVQTGIGPFLAIYLASRKWTPESVGLALTVGGLAGVVAQAPAGAIVDAARRKRSLILVGVLAIVTAALLLAFYPTRPVVWSVQISLGLVAAMIGPAVAATTLGLVGAKGFDRRFGRNQSFASAGNVVAALLMGAIGYLLSNRAIFLAVPFFAVPCLIALGAISAKEISFEAARGNTGQAEESGAGSKTSLITLLADRKILCFAACAVLFHFANAAMLPQLGEMLAQGRARQAAPFMSACVIVTQAVIACSAAWIGRQAATRGRRPLLLLGFGVLPIRGILYTLTSSFPLLIGIQLLDGVANAIFGVVSVLVIADLTRGSGRFNTTQGALGAAVGLGAAFSTTVAGYIVQHAGYSASFLSLAAIAACAWLLLFFFMPETSQQHT